MTTVKATVKDRRLDLEVPDDWPDGIQVEIHPRGQQRDTEPDVMTPEEIARTLAAMDRVEPFALTDAEHVALELERQTAKERDKAQFAEHAEQLHRMWE